MAQQTQIVLTCDLDPEPTPAVGTYSFSFDGQAYEFELCAAHLEEFTKVLQGFADAARRTGGRRASTARPRGGSVDIAVVRDWARRNGYEVSARGRIPAEIRQAFDAANG